MKKLMITFFASILMLGLSSISMAQDTTTNVSQNRNGRNFVDKNNDGICDNFPAGSQGLHGRNFADKNNDGICDNRGVRGQNFKGRNFVDKNNDGVCDNQGKGNNRNGRCCGYGQQQRQRNGRK